MGQLKKFKTNITCKFDLTLKVNNTTPLDDQYTDHV